MRRILLLTITNIILTIILYSGFLAAQPDPVSTSFISPSYRIAPKIAQEPHTVTDPIIILPINGSKITYFFESVRVEWIAAADTLGHEFTYSLNYFWFAEEPGPLSHVWNFIATVEGSTKFTWDLPFIIDGIVQLRVTAECSEGLVSEAIIQVEFQHEIPLMVVIGVILVVVGLIFLVLFLPAFYRRRQESGPIGISAKGGEQLPLGIAIGLFDENRGIRIEQKNDLLTDKIDDSEILSSLTYSGRMYQPDKLNTLYGPFPILGKENTRENWIFEIYWTKLIDKSSVDPRIIKNLMQIPIVFLLVYNQDLQPIFEKRRRDIMESLQTATAALKDVESLDENSCKMIQDHILDRLRVSR
ncbi:MAG: hypothetical protein ACFFE8_03405 [Candidatus Heimdallarchaeota archaeon]